MRKGEYTDGDGVRRTSEGYPLCTAHNQKTGKPCDARAMNYTNVCPKHGGRAPQVKRAVSARKKAVEAAPDVMDFFIEQYQDDTLPARERQSAGNSILDRAGVGRVAQLEVNDAQEMFRQKLLEKAREQRVIEGEVVDDEEDDGTELL